MERGSEPEEALRTMSIARRERSPARLGRLALPVGWRRAILLDGRKLLVCGRPTLLQEGSQGGFSFLID